MAGQGGAAGRDGEKNIAPVVHAAFGAEFVIIRNHKKDFHSIAECFAILVRL